MLCKSMECRLSENCKSVYPCTHPPCTSESMVATPSASCNSQSDAIAAYIKEFDILADDTVSKNIAFKGSLLLSKYASIFRRLLHT